MTKYTFPFPKHCIIIINNFRVQTKKKLHYKNINNLTLQGQPHPITECNFLGFAEFQPANESWFLHTWCKTSSFSFNCSIRNVPRKQNTNVYTKIGCEEDPAAFHHPSTAWEEILCGSWRENSLSWRMLNENPSSGTGEGLGLDFWDIHSSTACQPPNLLFVTPVLEQDCCKLKFHPSMAPGICLHCVNIFNGSSCNSLPKLFPPFLIFSILSFPDSCSTSKALSTSHGISIKRLEFSFCRKICAGVAMFYPLTQNWLRIILSQGTFQSLAHKTLPMWSCWDNRAWEKSPIT